MTAQDTEEAIVHAAAGATPVSGGELVARTLASAGVTHAFGLHGGHLEAIFQGCVTNGIAITDVRDEAAGGHAAEGYARSLRTLGVALATAGPGITNVITSIANASIDRVPVLYITGAEMLAHAGTNMMQGDIDNVAIARPLTKWAYRVTNTADIPRHVAHAIRVATTAPCGPVLLEFPVDVTFIPIDPATAPIPTTIATDAVAAPQNEAIAAALELLISAQRPVLLAGEGATQSRAEEELRAFAEATGIPVFTHNNSHGLLPSDHPLHGGTFFKLAELATPGQRPDVVLAVGTRFGAFTLAQGERIVPADARVIHIEADATEIGRRRSVDVAILADSREALRSLVVGATNYDWPDLTSWQQTVSDATAARYGRLQPLLEREDDAIHPLQAAAAIVDTVPEDTILIGDGAETQEWLLELARQQRPASYFGAGQLGCLGYGLGFAVGVQVAQPDRPVVLVTGDGAVGITIAEFDTMARHKLPIVVVVFNNRMWGATRHFQAIFSGPDHHIATELADTRYDLVAEGFGCRGVHVTALDELRPALQGALAGSEPTCINVSIDFGEAPPDEMLLLTSF